MLRQPSRLVRQTSGGFSPVPDFCRGPLFGGLCVLRFSPEFAFIGLFERALLLRSSSGELSVNTLLIGGHKKGHRNFRAGGFRLKLESGSSKPIHSSIYVGKPRTNLKNPSKRFFEVTLNLTGEPFFVKPKKAAISIQRSAISNGNILSCLS